MGVTKLWQILSPVELHCPLSSLQSQTLAIDLSIWVCETQAVKEMQGVVSKPYLRNLFFRISHLTILGVKLVFVIEGTTPELKWDTMVKRQQARFPERQGKQTAQRPPDKQTRKNFSACLKECCELLEILGIPYIQSKGEAEALCALLNSAGLVDGCLTNDGDVFLYGARTVYRNFTMNSKDPHVEMYRMSDIESQLGIDRNGLVALGLLIGCDFIPKGVPGVGSANAVRLLQSLRGRDIIERLKAWRNMAEHECVDQIEIQIRKKALAVHEFPQLKVINEFLVAKDRCPSRLSPWKRPVPDKLQEFAALKLDWPMEYTLEKVLPLVTLWDMKDILQSQNPSPHQHLKPHRIVKAINRQGEPCYEIEWNKPVTDTIHEGSYYVTVESQDLFDKSHPQVVKNFTAQTVESKKKTAKAKKKKKRASVCPTGKPPLLDKLSFNLEKMDLADVTNTLKQSVKELQMSFSESGQSFLTTKVRQPKHLTLENSYTKTKHCDSSHVFSDHGTYNNILKCNEFFIDAKHKTDINTNGVLEGNVSADDLNIPLHERIKLKLQHKQMGHHVTTVHSDSTCHNTNSMAHHNRKALPLFKSEANVSDVMSVLEEMGNLSLNEPKSMWRKPENVQQFASNNILPSSYHSLHMIPVESNAHLGVTRHEISFNDFQRMSSPSAETFCSPLTYIRQSFKDQSKNDQNTSPIPTLNGSFCNCTENCHSIVNVSDNNHKVNMFKEETHKNNSKVCMTADDLIAKISAGISQVGKKDTRDPKLFSSDSLRSFQALGDSLFSKSLSSPVEVPKTMFSTPLSQGLFRQHQNPANHHAYNNHYNTSQNSSYRNTPNVSQFGNFQLQHSLLNSMCTSLIQALTPKGISMSREEYESLLTTLNEIDQCPPHVGGKSCEKYEKIDTNVNAEEDVSFSVELSDLEKASANFRKLNKVYMKPINLDESVESGELSKQARKKLRRRQRKMASEIESANLENSINCSLHDSNVSDTSDNKGEYQAVEKQNSLCSRQPEKTSQKGRMSISNGNCSVKKNSFICAEQLKSVTTPICYSGKSNERSLKQNVKLYNSCTANLSHTAGPMQINSNNIASKDQCENLKSACAANTNISLNNQCRSNNEQFVEKAKKKKKKKKTKKGSVTNTSMGSNGALAGKVVDKCSEYLRKALENNPRSKQIKKSSSVMDLSADDTLLELEELSCKLVGVRSNSKSYAR